MTKLYFDIETSVLPPDQLDKFMPKNDEWALGNASKPETVARIIAEKKLEWIDRAALSAITGQIIAVSFADGAREPLVLTDVSERLLIEQTLNNLTLNNGPIYTWNGSGFDLPYLCQRAAVYGIPAWPSLTQVFRGKFYWNENLIDAKQVWSMYSSDHRDTSLAKVALALGVGEKIGNGKDFAELLKTDHQKAIEYCKNDVVLLRKIIQAMGI